MTDAQQAALKWLKERGGTGVFEKNNSVLIAAGERSSSTRTTWNILRDLGHVTIENPRITITGEN